MKVGFIGLGTMGLPMVKNLLKAEIETFVISRSRAPIDEAISLGAQEARYPNELIELADVVFTCLPSLASSEQIYFGENGLVSPESLEGKIVLETSTVSPQLNKRQAEAIEAKGGAFLDAPLSGGPMGAQAATLTIMCGGKGKAFQQVLPILNILGKNIFHVGDVGAGSVAKLINNMLVGIHTAAMAEAFSLGKKAGVDPDMLHQILKVSTGHSFMIDRTIGLIQQRDFEQRFMVDLLLKDMRLAVAMGEENGMPLELGRLTEQAISEVSEMGYGKLDIAAIIRRLEDKTGVLVKREE